MDSGALEPMKKIIEELLEEKFQIRGQIEKLNKMYATREKNIENFTSLYLDLKSSIELDSAKVEMENKLHGHSSQVASNILPGVKDPKNETSANKPSESREVVSEWLEIKKKEFSKFRRNLRGLVKGIKTELDVYKACFDADAEILYLKIWQASFPCSVDESPQGNSSSKETTNVKSTEFRPANDSSHTSDEVSAEDFGAIRFSGITKKKNEKPLLRGEHSIEESQETVKDSTVKSSDEASAEDFGAIKFPGIVKKMKTENSLPRSDPALEENTENPKDSGIRSSDEASNSLDNVSAEVFGAIKFAGIAKKVKTEKPRHDDPSTEENKEEEIEPASKSSDKASNSLVNVSEEVLGTIHFPGITKKSKKEKPSTLGDPLIEENKETIVEIEVETSDKASNSLANVSEEVLGTIHFPGITKNPKKEKPEARDSSSVEENKEAAIDSTVISSDQTSISLDQVPEEVFGAIKFPGITKNTKNE